MLYLKAVLWLLRSYVISIFILKKEVMISKKFRMS